MLLSPGYREVRFEDLGFMANFTAQSGRGAIDSPESRSCLKPKYCALTRSIQEATILSNGEVLRWWFRRLVTTELKRS